MEVENYRHHAVLQEDFFSNSDYQAIRVLGSGGFGSVLLAERKRDPAIRFAMKQVYLFSPKEHPDAHGKNERRKVMFKAETAVMRRLNNKYIMPCLFALECTEYLTIFMPYFPGGTLSHSLRVLTTRKMRVFSKQLTMALHYMHGQLAYHADIKPDNILVADDRIVLSDFGLSGIVDSPDTKIKHLRGTPGYRAPECDSEGPVNPFLVDCEKLNASSARIATFLGTGHTSLVIRSLHPRTVTGIVKFLLHQQWKWAEPAGRMSDKKWTQLCTEWRSRQE